MPFKESTRKIKDYFKDEIKTFRIGRAHVDLISDVLVEAYGAKQPLSQIASISVQDARMLVVEAWDKGLIKDIEKGILSSGKNVSVAVDGNIIRVSVPEMTEENRRAMVKTLNEKLEKARVSMRKSREEEKKKIESQEKQGTLSEDQAKRQLKDMEQDTKEAISALEQEAEKKEKEITTI